MLSKKELGDTQGFHITRPQTQITKIKEDRPSTSKKTISRSPMKQENNVHKGKKKGHPWFITRRVHRRTGPSPAEPQARAPDASDGEQIFFRV